jgi:hypothetical protein
MRPSHFHGKRRDAGRGIDFNGSSAGRRTARVDRNRSARLAA